MINLECKCGARTTVPGIAAGHAGQCGKCRNILRMVTGSNVAEGDPFDTWLFITSGPGRVGEQMFFAGTGVIAVGKLPESGVILQGAKVSRYHCTLSREDATADWHVDDHNSTNGLFVNQKPTKGQRLSPGDVVGIGEFQLEYRAASDRANGEFVEVIEDTLVAPGDEPDELYAIAEAPKIRAPSRIQATAAQPSGPGPVCPSCNNTLPSASKICVACGIDILTGKPLVTAHGVDEDQLEITTQGVLRWLSFAVPIGVAPIASEAYGKHKPYVTWAIAGLTTVVSIIFWLVGGLSSDPSPGLQSMLLWSGKPSALRINLAYRELGPIVDWVDRANGWSDFSLFESENHAVVPKRQLGQLVREASIKGKSEISREDAEADSDARAIAYARKKEELHATVGDDALPIAAYEQLDSGDRVLPHFRWYQLVTNTFLHGGLMHLVGNMVFLLVLAGRVNAALGQARTVILYLAFGVIASAAHLISAANGPLIPALGASGAIMGMAGMYFILFPVHKIFMAFWVRPAMLLVPLLIFIPMIMLRLIFFRFIKVWRVRGFWVLLFFIAFDVVATVRGSKDGTAHWAHLGGFIAGMIVAVGLLILRSVNSGGGDLISVILGRRAWTLIGKPTDRHESTVIAVPNVRAVDMNYR